MTASLVMQAMRHWWFAVVPLSVMLAAGLGAVVWYLFEPVYQAEAWLRIDNQSPYIAFQSKERGTDRYVETQVALIRSPLVLSRVVGMPEVAQMPELAVEEDPIEWMDERLSVVPVGESELFRIRFDGPHPQHAASIVNAVTKNYFDLRSQDEVMRTQRVIEVLEAQKERRSQTVARLRENVRELSKQTTGRDPFGAVPAAGEVGAMQTPVAQLQDRLTSAEVQREVLQAEVQAYEEALARLESVVPEATVQHKVDNHPDVMRLKEMLSSLHFQMLEVERTAAKPEESRLYQKLKEDVAGFEQALQELGNQLFEEFHAELKGEHTAVHISRLADKKAKLSSLQLTEQLLRKRYNEELGNLKQSSGQTLELKFAMAELTREEKVFELIADRVLALRTETQRPERVSLLRGAIVPLMPVESLPAKHLALAGLFSLALPVAGAVFWERRLQRVSNSKQLAMDPKFGVIWEVANLPLRGRGHRRSARAHRKGNLFAESVNSLRTGLMLTEPLRDMKVLAVTSAVAQEGKTSLAAELAISMAQSSGQPTLLIDGDLRAPDIHRVFEVPLEPGLSRVLDGEVALDEAIVTDWGNSVHLLPAGKLHKNPHELFGQRGLKPLLEELRRAYRYIIIDTPPILSASEALIIAEAADATLICCRRDRSRVDQLESACDRLAGAGREPVGTVLNGVTSRAYRKTYGKYYSYT